MKARFLHLFEPRVLGDAPGAARLLAHARGRFPAEPALEALR